MHGGHDGHVELEVGLEVGLEVLPELETNPPMFANMKNIQGRKNTYKNKQNQLDQLKFALRASFLIVLGVNWTRYSDLSKPRSS